MSWYRGWYLVRPGVQRKGPHASTNHVPLYAHQKRPAMIFSNLELGIHIPNIYSCCRLRRAAQHFPSLTGYKKMVVFSVYNHWRDWTHQFGLETFTYKYMHVNQLPHNLVSQRYMHLLYILMDLYLMLPHYFSHYIGREWQIHIQFDMLDCFCFTTQHRPVYRHVKSNAILI